MRIAVVFALSLAAIAADKTKPYMGTAANQQIKVEAVVYLNRETIKEKVGVDMNPAIVLAELKVTPVGDAPVKIWREEFVLHSFKDGQKSTPFAASEIAGNNVLVISHRAGEGGGVAGQNNGPTFGGLGGTFGGFGNGGGIGNTASTTEAVAEAKSGDEKAPPNPLLKRIEDRLLPQNEISGPVGGELYFLLEGKHKAKDLQLLYKGVAGKLVVTFQ
jgi:hypothetical protein